jgi:muconolactone delta-isomerase
MQYLILFRRRTEDYTESEFAALVGAEVQQARQLYMDGVIRQIWHRADVPGACLLIEAASQEEVEAALQTLPLVQKNMLEVVINVPLKPYAGFAPNR